MAEDDDSSTEELLNTIVDTIQVYNTPTEDLLRLLAAQINLNLIIGPDSMGTVSLRFAGVTVGQALDAILQAKGYQYELYGNIMLISAPDSLERRRGLGLETRMFHLKYSNARDIKTTIDTSKVLSPWGYTSVYARSISTNAAKASYLKPQLERGRREEVTLEEPITGDKTPLQARTDILLVTDRPPNLKRVAKLIEMLDKPVRQVDIEVHFVETILDDNQQLGINWSQLLRTEGRYQGRTKWTLGNALPSEEVEELFTGTGGAGSALSAASPVGEEGGSGAMEFGSLASTRFMTILDLMLKDEKAKMLSQPRITTIESQPATIIAGITFWLEEREGSMSEGDLRITYTERQIPIELVVVPHILHNNRIMLELRPRVEEISGWQTGYGGMQLPLITTRTADSRVEVADGETAVIGGLIKEKTLITEKRVWLLGSIPLLGHLFRHKVESKQRTDLTIFITPRIIMPGEPHRSPPEEMIKSETEPEREHAPEVAEANTPREVRNEIDMHRYFPLTSGAQWNYLWSHINGEKWESRLSITGNGGDIIRMRETIPEGPKRCEARSGFLWSDMGMLNVYRVYQGGDSMSYSPRRVILPKLMAEGEVYENRYAWKRWQDRRAIRSGEVIQRQRLVGKFTVTTGAGRFRDCIGVETISYEIGAPVSEHKRKVIWYASDVGPVKVESEIPQGKQALEGALSAMLVER